MKRWVLLLEMLLMALSCPLSSPRDLSVSECHSFSRPPLHVLSNTLEPGTTARALTRSECALSTCCLVQKILVLLLYLGSQLELHYKCAKIMWDALVIHTCIIKLLYVFMNKTCCPPNVLISYWGYQSIFCELFYFNVCETNYSNMDWVTNFKLIGKASIYEYTKRALNP